MKHLMTIFFSIAFCASCTEPFNFELPDSSIVVFDAKVSTVSGNSFVSVYNQNGEETNSLQGFTIEFQNSDGLSIALTYVDSLSIYLPQQAEFQGKVGESYRMIAIDPLGNRYETQLDQIMDSIPFSIQVKDTVIKELIDETNLIIEKPAKAAVAVLPLVDANVKLEFGYEFADYFSGDLESVRDLDNFVLFSSFDQGQNEPENVKVTVGNRLVTTWIFFDTSRPTNECVNAPECGEDPCCGNPCCKFEETWPVTFEVFQESLSNQAFDFWQEVDRLRSNNGLLFDTYPFPISGNITCETCTTDFVGFFRAVSESSKQALVII